MINPYRIIYMVIRLISSFLYNFGLIIIDTIHFNYMMYFELTANEIAFSFFFSIVLIIVNFVILLNTIFDKKLGPWEQLFVAIFKHFEFIFIFINEIWKWIEEKANLDL